MNASFAPVCTPDNLNRLRSLMFTHRYARDIGLLNPQRRPAIVTGHVIAIAKAVNSQVVAEGIENAAQAAQLRAMGAGLPLCQTHAAGGLSGLPAGLRRSG